MLVVLPLCLVVVVVVVVWFPGNDIEWRVWMFGSLEEFGHVWFFGRSVVVQRFAGGRWLERDENTLSLKLKSSTDKRDLCVVVYPSFSILTVVVVLTKGNECRQSSSTDTSDVNSTHLFCD